MPQMNKKKSETHVKHAEKALSQSMHAFNVCLNCVPFQKNKFETSCLQTCRLFQDLSKQIDCLKWIGEIISTNSLDKDQLEFMVVQWLKCKLVICKQLNKEFSGIERKSIVDYITHDSDQSKAFDSFIIEINYYKQLRKRPPTFQFQVFSKLLQSCELKPLHMLAQGLLVHLSHAWPNDFSSSYTVSSIVELFESYCKSETIWEVKFIIGFYCYMYAYEYSLMQINKSKQTFDSSQNSLSNNKVLKWFPTNIPVPDRTFLICIVNILKHTVIENIILSEEVLECFQVLIMFLDLFEERVLILETLKVLEPVLSSLNKTGNFLGYTCFVWIKCYQSKIASSLKNHQEALAKAEEAMLLVKEFTCAKNAFVEKLTKFEESKLQFTFIIAQLTFAYSLLENKKKSKAHDVVKDILNNNYISPGLVNMSRTSALASSHVDILLSHISEYILIDSIHPLNSALSSLSTICMRFDMVCPGIIQVLSCYESANKQQQPPYFGKNGKTFSFDMVLQFKYLLQLVNTLYRVSYLWLKSGNIPFSRLYITDGIILCRYLSLPEKELKFERLLAELTLLELDVDRFGYELSIMFDIINYISALHKKEKPHRTRLCYADLNKDHKPIPKVDCSLNTKDEDFFIKSVELDISSVAPSSNVDSTTSPTLPRKKNSKKKYNLFFHKQPCDDCHICSNFFLLQEQCKLALLCARYHVLNDNNTESETYLYLAKTLVLQKDTKNVFFQKQVDSLAQSFNNINVIASLAEIYFQFGNIQSSKAFTYKGLQLIKDSPFKVDNHSASTLFKIAGNIHFPARIFSEFDTSLFIDMVIDLPSKLSRFPLSLQKDLEANIACMKISSDTSAVKKKIDSERAKPFKTTSNTKFKIFDDESNTDTKFFERKTTKKTKAVSFSKRHQQTQQQLKMQTQLEVFDFPSDDSNEIASVNTLNYKTPRKTRNTRQCSIRNVMAARKEAEHFHKKEWGMLYIDDEIEGARPATRNRKASKLSKKNAGELLAFESLGRNHRDAKNMYNDCASFLSCFKDADTNIDCNECLEKCFHISTLSCDFCKAKQAAQLLAIHHFQKVYCSSAYHIISLGITLRITSHINMILSYKSIERKLKKKKESEMVDNGNHEYYLTALQSMIEFTHPKQSLSVSNSRQFINHICCRLPVNWSICFLSFYCDDQKKILMITRLRKNESPLHLQLDGKMLNQLSINFNHFLEFNVKGMKTTDKSLWWTQRRNANKLLESFNNELEKSLGYHVGILLGSCIEENCQNVLAKCLDSIIDIISKYSKYPCYESRNLIEIYLYVWNKLSPKNKLDLVLQLLSLVMVCPDEVIVSDVFAVFEKNSVHFSQHNCKRGHVVLILDKGLQRYPWESISTLRSQSLSRMTSIDTLLWQLELNKIDNYTKANLSKVAYVVNPNKDLLKTEERFAEWFSSINTWHGVVSRIPSKSELFSCISDHDVFVFCGHGSGFPSLFSDVLSRRQVSASALLMGCSSGVLRESGLTEPEGTAISYLMSGSPCVLACLWAVTDKDIDLYLAKCLNEWMKEGTSLTETVRKSESACKFPKLNGASCVVYGVPVYSCKTVLHWLANAPGCFKDVLS